MAFTADRTQPGPLHPVHAVLLGGAFALFLGVLLSDWAYASSYEVQWKNFASWLLVGGLVFAGFAGLWAVAGLIWPRVGRTRALIYLLVLLACWVLGFINALVHAMDAWESMPASLILSVLVVVLALAAIVLASSSPRRVGEPA